jgi:hypothetical protein
MFSLFRKVHIEGGTVGEAIISERWRLLRPFHGKNDLNPKTLERMMRDYVNAYHPPPS